MKKSSIQAFIDKAIFNPAAGNEKISFKKMSKTVFFTILIAGIAFSFPLSIPSNCLALVIKLSLLFVLFVITGLFCSLSIRYSEETQKRNIFKSVIYFDCQCTCMSIFPLMINYSFYESTKKLTIGVIESGVTIAIFVIATIIWVRGKIRKGAYTSKGKTEQPKYPVIISMVVYIIMVQIGKESIGIMVQLATIVFNAPFIILSFNLMQLYYARKYDMRDIIDNESFVRRARARI